LYPWGRFPFPDVLVFMTCRLLPIDPSSFINNRCFASEHEVCELILSDLPLAEQSWQSLLLFWLFQLLLLTFCLEQS
jgi:hypothetical protein